MSKIVIIFLLVCSLPNFLFADLGIPPMRAYTKVTLVGGDEISGFMFVFGGGYDADSGKCYVRLSEKTILLDLSKDVIKLDLSDKDRKVAAIYAGTETPSQIFTLTRFPQWKCGPEVYEELDFRKIKSLTIYINPTDPDIKKTIQKFNTINSSRMATCPSVDGGYMGDAGSRIFFDPTVFSPNEVKNFLTLLIVTTNGIGPDYDRDYRAELLTEPLKPVPPGLADTAGRLLQQLKEEKTEIPAQDVDKIEKFKKTIKFWNLCQGWTLQVAGSGSGEAESIRNIYR